MLIDEPTMPPHPFLPPLLEKLSLLQRLHRHASSLSHWAHLMWMLPLSIFTAIGLLHLTTLLRSSPTMQRAADGVLHLIELAQDALHAVIKLCRWYWRDRLQPLESAIDQCTSWIDDRAHAVAGSINTAAAAAKGRIQLLSNSITRSSNAVRSALASAVQLSLPHPGQLWTAYVLPIYESTKSSLHGAASSQLFLRLVSFGDRLSTGVRRTDEWVSLWLRGASHLVRDSRLVVLASDVSRTVVEALFGSISPSPPASPQATSPLSTISRTETAPLRLDHQTALDQQTVDGREHFQDLAEEERERGRAADRATKRGRKAREEEKEAEEEEEEAEAEGERKQVERGSKLKMPLWQEAVRNRQVEKVVRPAEIEDSSGSSAASSPSSITSTSPTSHSHSHSQADST